MSTELMIKQFEGQNVFFQLDGWFNATSVAKMFGKDPYEWGRLPATQCYIEELIKEFQSHGNPVKGIQRTDFIKTKRGKPENGGGTWLHPELAVEFARWCNVKFARWCDRQIKQLIEDGKPSQTFTRPFFPTWWNNELGFEQVTEAEDVHCKRNRVGFDQTIKITCGLRNPVFIRNLTNMVFRAFTGFEVKDFRRGWGIPKGSRVRTRLFVDSNLRRAIDVVEAEAMHIIQQNNITEFADIFDMVGDLANAQMMLCRANRIQLFRSVPVNMRLVTS